MSVEHMALALPDRDNPQVSQALRKIDQDEIQLIQNKQRLIDLGEKNSKIFADISESNITNAIKEREVEEVNDRFVEV